MPIASVAFGETDPGSWRWGKRLGSQNKPPPGDQEGRGEDQPQADNGHAGGGMTAKNDSRQRSYQKRAQEQPVDRAHQPMTHASSEGQRHSVSDVGADNASQRQLRVEQNQNRDADRAGTDR